MHFIKPKAFLSIMPRYIIPAGLKMICISGFAEIGLGIMLCFEETKTYAI